MTSRDSLLAALIAVIWGLNFLVIDWGLAGMPPLVFVAVRFALVAFPAVFLVPAPRAAWWKVAAVGVFMSLGHFGFMYVALAAGLPPGIAALVIQGQVGFTILIAAMALQERPTRWQLVGVMAGALGLFVVAVGRGGHVPLAALLVCALGALSWGVGNVVARAAGVASGFSLTVWSALVVPVPALGLAVAMEGVDAVVHGIFGFGWRAALSTAYTVMLASLVGNGLFNTLLVRYRSAAVVPWILLAPIVAMTAAWFLLGHQPSPGEALGGVLLVVGVLVATADRPLWRVAPQRGG